MKQFFLFTALLAFSLPASVDRIKALCLTPGEDCRSMTLVGRNRRRCREG